MGYVGTYCQLSACCPTAPDDLQSYWLIERALERLEDKEGTKRLRDALQAIRDEEAQRVEMMVVGPIKEDGESIYPMEGDFLGKSDEIIKEHLDSLRIVPQCTAGEYYEFGSVSAPAIDKDYLVSYGPCIFIMSAALPILYLATRGRMTLKRLWEFTMRQGRIENSGEWVLTGIEYGEIEPCIHQFLTPLPALADVNEDDSPQVVQGWMEQAKTVEEMKKVLVLEQKYWVWMAPDVFPLEPSPALTPPPTVTSPPTASPASSSSPSPPSLSTLPFDLLVHISSLLPLPSLLCLTATCRTLRASLLSSSTKRNRLANAWLTTTGRYWLPLRADLGRLEEASDKPVEEKEVRLKEVELLELEEEDGWWDYLRRCAAESGSMRNRKRVWETVLDIERAVDAAGM
ncbi:hypothetical protein JCM6882_002634 [Rhodosporidiobolus microsporus]